MATLFTLDDKDTWPRDSREYVFLARAIDALGREVMGELWTGKEISAGDGTMPLEFRAGSVWASNQAREWSRALILKYAPASTIQEASRLDREAHDRFERVTREITDHCAWGRLVSAARWEDGSFGEMHCDRWNNPKPRWFARCKIPAKEAFDQNWNVKDHLPIFIRRAELEVLNSPRPDAGREDPSPAASVPRSRRTAQQGSIERAISELWNGHIPLGLTILRRNEQIQQFAGDRKLAIPSDRTIARHLGSKE